MSENYAELDVTVFLTRGNHHVFSCPAEGAQEGEICSLRSMKPSNPQTDNVNLVVMPLYCDSIKA